MGTVEEGREEGGWREAQLWPWDNKRGPGVEKKDRGGHRLLGGVLWTVQASGSGDGPRRVPSVALYCLQNKAQSPQGGSRPFTD